MEREEEEKLEVDGGQGGDEYDESGGWDHEGKKAGVGVVGGERGLRCLWRRGGGAFGVALFKPCRGHHLLMTQLWERLQMSTLLYSLLRQMPFFHSFSILYLHRSAKSFQL